MLTQDQKDFYAENGYLKVEGAVTGDLLSRLQEVTNRLIEASREVTDSNDVYDLDTGHTAEAPRLTRIKLPHKQDPVFWEALTQSGVTEVLTDLLGPDTYSTPPS